MIIRQPILALIALLVLPVLGYFVVDRVQFLARAERTMGTVDSVTATNGSCSGSRKRSSYSCTRFNAKVSFLPLNGVGEGRLTLSAGSARGHNQSLTLSQYREGQSVPVVYDPKNIGTVYNDSFMGVWAVPFMLFIFQIGSALGSFAQGKARYTYRYGR